MQFITDISSMNALNQRRLNGLDLGRATERLETSLRINRGADDPSGLGISAGMKSKVRGLNEAAGNVQDGLKMLETMDAAMSEMQAMLMRMRDLSVRAANEATLTDADRNKLHNEARSLQREIDRLSQSTTYNTKKLLTIPVDYSQSTPETITTSMGAGNKMFLSKSGNTAVIQKNGDIYAFHTDTNQLVQLTSGPDTDTMPQWERVISDDGQKIVFIRNGNQLYSMNTDGSDMTLLDTFPLSNINSSIISGDGKKVIYLTNGSFTYIVDTDGKNRRQYSDPSSVVHLMDFNEDGSQVLYSRYGNIPNIEDLCVNNSEKTNEVELVNSYNQEARFSDSGKIIYYDVVLSDFFTIDPDGTNVTNITNSPAAFESGIYGAAGDWVSYYASYADPQGGIYLTNADEKNRIRVLDNPGFDGLPNGNSGDGRVVVYTGIIPGIGAAFKLIRAATEKEMPLQVGPDNGESHRIDISIAEMGSNALGIGNITLTRQDGAEAAIGMVDGAIARVSSRRAYAGEMELRLRHVWNDIDAQSIHVSAGRSRIEDADMASEATDLVRAQIRQTSNIEAVVRADELARSVLDLIEQNRLAA